MSATVDPQRAREVINAFAGQRVLILGDVMLDQFLVGHVHRISPEAPVPVIVHERDEFRLGGAANVAHNLTSLGASVRLIGVVGADDAADQVRRGLRAVGVDAADLVEDPSRPTTRKLRIITDRHQQVARVDYELDREIAEGVEHAIESTLRRAAQRARVIIISDYLKGVVTRTLTATAIECGKQRGIPVLVDPKIPHIDRYQGATLVTPNHHEAEVATHLQIRTADEARAAARAFRERVGCDSVLITRGSSGMWLLGKYGSVADADKVAAESDGFFETELSAAAREVADVTGAGDTVVATVALCLASGGTLLEAAQLANQAAGISVSKFGPATVTPEELLGSLA